MPSSPQPSPAPAPEEDEEEAEVVHDRASIASIDLGRPMNCLSVLVHPFASLAAVGGAQALKIVSISPNGLSEKRNVRLTSKATSQVNFTINDVDWGSSDASKTTLASGLSNGHIGIWDVSKDGRAVLCQEFGAHSRAVNRLNWHAVDDPLLLSASQDTLIKLWDRRGRSFSCQLTFTPRAEAVRDVQWNPHQPHVFAAACENGSLQVWDRRKPASPLLRIMGHSGPLLALEWHLSEPHLLATGARDRTIKIWDTGERAREDVAIKETYVINTIHPVGRIRWRPGYPDHLAATSSVAGDHAVSVWHVRSPYVPLATLEGHSDVCTSLHWLDTPCRPKHGDAPGSPGTTGGSESRRTRTSSGGSGWGWGSLLLGSSGAESEVDDKGMAEFTDYLGVWQHLLSSGRDGRLVLHSLARAQRPRDHLTPVVLGLSVRGELLACHEEIDRSDELAGVAINDRVENAPGLFAESRAGRMRAASTDEDRWNPAPPPLPGSSSSHASPPLPSVAARSLAPHLRSVGLPPPASSSLARQPGHTQAGHVGPSMGPQATSQSVLGYASSASSLDGAQAAMLGGPTVSPGTTLTQREAMAMAAQLQQAFLHPPLWLPRYLHLFTWDDTLLGGPPPYDAPLEALSCVSYADLVSNLATSYCLRPGAKDWGRADGDDEGPGSDGSLAVDEAGIRVPRRVTLSRCRRARARLCQRNAQVAFSACQGRVAHIWHVLGVLLGGAQGAQRAGQSSDEEEGEEEGTEGSEGRSRDGEEDVEGREARSRSGSLVRRTPEEEEGERRRGDAEERGGGVDAGLRSAVLTQLVEEMIEDGDVQNCVTLCEVLTSTCGDLEGEQLADLVHVDAARIREVYLGYIDILQRLELYQAANDLVAFTVEVFIQKLNMTTTSVYASCASCRRPINSVATPNGSAAKLQYCAKCRLVVSQCSICQQPVRGVFVVCPGCSHGGHLEHMRDWFAIHRHCPTGCGHVCNIFRDVADAAVPSRQAPSDTAPTQSKPLFGLLS